MKKSQTFSPRCFAAEPPSPPTIHRKNDRVTAKNAIALYSNARVRARPFHLHHEGPRISTKPCGGLFTTKGHEVARSHATAYSIGMPVEQRAQRFHTIFSAKGHEGPRSHAANTLRRKASCSFVSLRGQTFAAWLRVPSCLFVVKTTAARLRASSCLFVVKPPPQGFVLLRASSW